MKKKIKEQYYATDLESGILYAFYLPKDLKPNDIIEIHHEEPYYCENNSHDGYTRLCVYRERDETDEEYDERIQNNKIIKEELRKRRYENYLKLKEEFETE